MRARVPYCGRAGRRPSSWLSSLLLLALSSNAAAQEDAPRGEGAVPRGPGGAIIKEAPPPEPAPSTSNIVMPKLTKFVEGVYPPEAAAAGLQAVVVVTLVIDRAGKVTKATVANPAGHGFDEAAIAATMGFEFEPATRDGKPIPVRIDYPFKFTITEKPAAPAPVPTTGNLGGTVRIAGPDVPLAGASVVVTGADGFERRVMTDEGGRWVLDAIPPGAYKVALQADGFNPFAITEQVEVGQATDVTYRMTPEVKGVEVTVRGELPPREVTKRTLERREMTRIPGTSGDALRSLQSLPGVARPPGIAGLLIVRGSAPQDTQIQRQPPCCMIQNASGGATAIAAMLDMPQ